MKKWKMKKKNLTIKAKTTVQNFEEDNNYIDYFIEIGIKPEIFKESFLYESSINELRAKLKPEIISKYPESNKKSIIVDNNELINQIFPNGLNIIETKGKPDPIFFSIIMSDNQLYNIIYRYKYISCLTIYESIADYRKLFYIYNENEKMENEEKKFIFNNFYIPKCLCLVSVHPCIDKYEEILKNIYENTINNKFNFFEPIN